MIGSKHIQTESAIKGIVYVADSREMPEIEDETIDLVITSPPYWHIKDYGIEGQIGYGQTLHEYLKDLYKVWTECFRVLKPGARTCINIGDQFLRSIIYGRYKIASLHSEVINQCEKIGFDYMGAIIWQKKTTMNTTGGANVMGSYPYPSNGMIEIDYEFILIFKKPGKRKVSKEIKERSKLSKEEWKEYFSGHWNFPGEKQIDHEAMFPDELPRRLIKMFSFVGDTVLDPFLGSGTTLKVALELNRDGIGYEINPNFVPIIEEKLGLMVNLVEFKKRNWVYNYKFENVDYQPYIKDIAPIIEPSRLGFEKGGTYKVVEVLSDGKIKLDTGLIVKFCGIEIADFERALKYLNDFIKGRQVFLKFDQSCKTTDKEVCAYVFLKNKIFVNKELVKNKSAKVANYNFKFRKRFEEIQNG
ncbi:MAG: site-specific DNA-methyltransferase [Candidatus Kryptonium sp.]|nr:site-specific DNA-methyltransferase [Candidatus Kryptonium sp.]